MIPNLGSQIKNLSLVGSILVGLTTTLAICLLLSSKYIFMLLDMYYKDNVYMAILHECFKYIAIHCITMGRTFEPAGTQRACER